MAIDTFQIPNLEYYDKEAKYVSPAKVSKASIDKIKERNIRLSHLASLGGFQFQ